MKKILSLVIGALLAIPLLVGNLAMTASAANEIKYPEPQGFVTDTINLLTAEQKSALEKNLSDFEKETSNEIAILIVSTTAPEEIDQYSIHVTDRWKPGKKDKDNGVLFTLAVEDRAARLEVGQGLEGVLTDLTSTKILDNIGKPLFREEKYYEGMLAVTETVKKIAKSEYNTQELEKALQGSATPNPMEDSVTILLFLVPFILSFFAGFFAKSKSIWAGGITGSVTGGVAGGIAGLSWIFIILTIIGGGILGLLIDKSVSGGKKGPHIGGGFWGGGGFHGGGGGGGGFGGFGGGGFSGGGGSSRW